MRALPTLPYQPNPYHARIRLARGLGDDPVVGFNVDFSPSPVTPLMPAESPTLLPTDDFSALTLAQDSTYLPTTEAQAMSIPTSKPVPPAASTSSFDWSKFLSSAVTAGGAVTTGVIQGQSAQNIARTQAAAAAQGQNALAQQAALLNSSVGAKLAALPKWLPWALGGGTILVIGFMMLRKHRKT